MHRDIRAMTGLATAGELLGRTALADALTISPRQLRAKMDAERPIHAQEIRWAVKALRERAAKAIELADKFDAILQEQS